MTDELELLRQELTARFRAAEAISSFAGEAQATWNSVINAFAKTQAQWEANLTFMYSDSIGYVTTGIGNKIDDSPRAADGVHAEMNLDAYGPALSMPWQHKDGSAASQDEIISEWRLVKSSYPGVQSGADAGITQLRLPQAFVNELVYRKMTDNERLLVQQLPDFGNAPADAQMATHGMAWAMGGGFVAGFPQFRDAFNRKDWVTAKAQSGFRLEAPQRRAGQDKMWDNAITVARRGLNPANLYYPGTVPAGGGFPQIPGGAVGGAVAVAIALGTAGFGWYYREDIARGAKIAYQSTKRQLVKVSHKIPALKRAFT